MAVFNPTNLFEIPPNFAANTNVIIPRNNSDIEEIVQLNIKKAKELVNDKKYEDDPIDRVNKMKEYLVHIRLMEQFLQDNKTKTRDKYQEQINKLITQDVNDDVVKKYQSKFTELQSDPAIEKEAYLVAPHFAIAKAWNESLDSAAGYTSGLERLIKSWMPLRYKFYEFYSTPENQAQYNDLVDAMKEHELTQKIEKDKEDRAIMGIMQVLVQSSSDENMKAQAVDMLNKALAAGETPLQIKKEEAKPAAQQVGGTGVCTTENDCGIFSKKGDKLIPMLQTPTDQLTHFVQLVTDGLVKSITDTLNARQPPGEAPLLPDQVRGMLENIVKELPKMEEDEREDFLEQVNGMLEDVVGRIGEDNVVTTPPSGFNISYMNPLAANTDSIIPSALSSLLQTNLSTQRSSDTGTVRAVAPVVGLAPTGPAPAPAPVAGPAPAPAPVAGPAPAPAPAGQQSSPGPAQRSPAPQLPVPPTLPKFIGLTAEQSPSPSPCTSLPNELRFGNVYVDNNIVYYNNTKWYTYTRVSADDILFNKQEEYTEDDVNTLQSLAILLQTPTTTLQDVINELYNQTTNEIQLKTDYQNFIIRTNLSIAFCIQGQRYAIGGNNILEVPLQAPAPDNQGLRSIWDKFREGQEFSRQLNIIISDVINYSHRSYSLIYLDRVLQNASVINKEIILLIFLIENIKEYGDSLQKTLTPPDPGLLSLSEPYKLKFVESLKKYTVFDNVFKYYKLAEKAIVDVTKIKSIDYYSIYIKLETNIQTRIIKGVSSQSHKFTEQEKVMILLMYIYSKITFDISKQTILQEYAILNKYSSKYIGPDGRIATIKTKVSVIDYVLPKITKTEKVPIINTTVLPYDDIINELLEYYNNNKTDKDLSKNIVFQLFHATGDLPTDPSQVQLSTLGGAPADPQPAQPPAPQAPNIPDDITTLKANLKKLNNISQMYSELTTQWQGYVKASEPRKEFKDISIGVLLNDL